MGKMSEIAAEKDRWSDDSWLEYLESKMELIYENDQKTKGDKHESDEENESRQEGDSDLSLSNTRNMDDDRCSK